MADSPTDTDRPTDAPDLVERATVRLVTFGGRIAALMIIAMTLLVAANVVVRAVPGLRSFTFVEEYTGYLFVGLAFLGLADTLRHEAHVRVTLVLGALGATARAWLEMGLALVALPVIGVIGWFGGKLFWHSLQTGEVAQTVMQTPLWIPRLSIPVGCALLILAFISHFRVNLRRALRERARKERHDA